MAITTSSSISVKACREDFRGTLLQENDLNMLCKIFMLYPHPGVIPGVVVRSLLPEAVVIFEDKCAAIFLTPGKVEQKFLTKNL